VKKKIKSKYSTQKFELNDIWLSNFQFEFEFEFFVFNSTFSNISAISWRPVLVVEEDGLSCENHRP